MPQSGYPDWLNAFQWKPSNINKQISRKFILKRPVKTSFNLTKTLDISDTIMKEQTSLKHLDYYGKC